jgi:hypothetical protein
MLEVVGLPFITVLLLIVEFGADGGAAIDTDVAMFV